MEKDFHYYCIGVLAKAAGFDKGDALTIAYASQYVDDATESTQSDSISPRSFCHYAKFALCSEDFEAGL
jgi:hypothetical protein